MIVRVLPEDARSSLMTPARSRALKRTRAARPTILRPTCAKRLARPVTVGYLCRLKHPPLVLSPARVYNNLQIGSTDQRKAHSSKDLQTKAGLRSGRRSSGARFQNC